MELIVERPEASIPEKAWIDKEKNTLEVDYHEFDKQLFYYVDLHKSIPLEHIEFMSMTHGKRGGFKRLEIRILKEYWNISNNHKELADKIFNLLEKSINYRSNVE